MSNIQITPGVTTGDQFETVYYPGDEIRLRVTEGGNVQVIEYISSDKEGPPPHFHPWHEVEFVIEGEVEFYVDGTWTRGGPGTVQMLPAGASHSVRVPSGEARLLYVTMGAPYDGMAREMAALYAAGDVSPAGIVEIANRHGVRLEGDTPFAQTGQGGV